MIIYACLLGEESAGGPVAFPSMVKESKTYSEQL